MSNRPIAIIFGITAAVLLLPAAFSHNGPPTFLATYPTLHIANSQVLERDTVTSAPNAGIAHAPAIVDLGNGELLCVWYQGSHESALDVGLYTARFINGHWRPAVRLTDAQATGEELGRYEKTVGNAIFVLRPQGELWLIYVSVSIGGWSGSHLNLKRSEDGGRTWSKAERLVTSPLFNLSTLVKGRPIELIDGSPAIPVHHQLIAQIPELLTLSKTGQVIDKIRIGPATGHLAIQPTIAVLSEAEAVALLRPRRALPRVYESRSSDGGRSWSVPRATNLANPGGPVGLVALDRKTLLLVFNNDPITEKDLTLAVSVDAGSTWVKLAILERVHPGERAAFTYPFLTRGSDSIYHLVYANPRSREIRHIRFNFAWVRSLLDKAGLTKASDDAR